MPKLIPSSVFLYCSAVMCLLCFAHTLMAIIFCYTRQADFN